MSLINPVPQNTIIKAYKAVPWDNSLKDIRLFDTPAQRDTFLNALLAGQWNQCSVVSVGKSIRVAAYYNNCIECNYLSFVNPQEGTKARTFYAYITSVNYVNVNTVEFTYEIDWIQTYLFDFVFEECLVEREHVNDDTMGKHVLEEGLEVGEYQVDYQQYMDFNPALVINVLPSNLVAQVPDNMYIPGYTRVFNVKSIDDRASLNAMLEMYNNTPERITTIFMGVLEMKPTNPMDPQSTFFHKTMHISEETSFNDSAAGPGATPYTPQNNKMLCYPYKLITADNYCGSVAQYRWENFNTPGSGDFAIEGSALPKPAMQFFPIDYRKTASTAEQRNTYEQEGLWYENFPAVNYATDSFRAWVSQYGTSFAVETAASVGLSLTTMAASIGTGNPMGAVSGAFGAVNAATSAYQEYKDHKLHSVQSHGGVSTSGLAYARDAVGFRITEYSISQDMAKRIDKFFTRYGYHVEEVKVPNIRGRRYLNYVRCSEALVAGNISVDAKLQMERALKQGTTFWHIDNMGGVITSNPIV